MTRDQAFAVVFLLLVKRKSSRLAGMLLVSHTAMEDESYWDDDGRNEEQSAPSSSSSSEKSPLRLPLYAQRHPPLVQPLETSAFAERTFGTFGIRDLGHEWVTLFQTIGEGNCGGYSKSMKLHVPDTILLSPSGYVLVESERESGLSIEKSSKAGS